MIKQKVKSSIRLKAHHLGMSELEFLRRVRELDRQTEMLLKGSVPTRKQAYFEKGSGHERQNKEPF